MIVPELDETIHQSTRLRIYAYLYANGETRFAELADGLDLTHGNLGSHLRRLERSGDVEVARRFVDRRPETTYRLNASGSDRFERYVDRLTSVTAVLEANSEPIEAE